MIVLLFQGMIHASIAWFLSKQVWLVLLLWKLSDFVVKQLDLFHMSSKLTLFQEFPIVFFSDH